MFPASYDAKPHHDPACAYSTVLHTLPVILYQGTSTTVPISVLGRRALPENRRFFLERRGWRTGLLGWTLGAWLGGTVAKEIDVTPAEYGNWEKDVGLARREQYDQETKQFIESGALPEDHKILESDFIHIPVASGDGYFRILIYYPTASVLSPIASTASFRVGSLSLSSSHPRGASFRAIVPEMLVTSASWVGFMFAWTAFYSVFPFLKAAQLVPFMTTWVNWAIQWLYKLTGAEAWTARLEEKYGVKEKKLKAEESVYRAVPLGAMGLRTAYDVEEDAKQGRGGVAYRRL